VGAGPVSVALADVNGDKNLDIVVANRLDKTVTVLMGAGDGTFRQPATFPLAAAPVAIAVGDLNKDGRPDLAVLEDCGAAKCTEPGSVEILLGAEAGTFRSLTTYSVGFAPSSLAIGDINGDKKLDIVVANRCGAEASCLAAGSGTVLLGDGTGKFAAGTTLSLGNSPSSIALGSLTGSGLDLVVSRFTDNTVAVLKGNGNGTFKAAVPYAVGNKPGPVVISDFNGDGKADVAVTNFTDATISVLYGRGDGTLQAAATVPTGTGPVAMAAIGGTSGGRSGLATANANTGEDSSGTEFSMSPDFSGTTDFTAFTLASATDPSSFNDGVLLTASITTPTTAAPAGFVVFAANGTALSDCNGATGEAVTSITTTTYTSSCTTHVLPPGATVSLTAEYLGDSTYADQTNTNTLDQEVDQLAPSLTLTTPLSTTSFNASVTFTATLSGVTFTPTGPTGSVNFTVGGTTITGCGTQGLTGEVATCTTSALAIGANQIVEAVYTGDTNYKTATAPTINQTVTQLAPSLTLTTPSSTTSFNASVTFTATLSGVTFAPTGPTGTVNFTVGGTTIGGCGTQGLTGEVATCTTTALAVGANQTIEAVYIGDTNFKTATAPTISQTVTQLTPTLTVTTPLSTTNFNASVTFTATLSGVTFTPTGPTGTVNFTVGGVTISGCGTQGLTGEVATCTTTTLAVGANQTIGAVYIGDTNYKTATAATISHTVSQLTPTLTLSSSGSSNLNTLVTFTATLSGVSFAPTGPTGTVAFTVGGSPITCNSPATINSTTGVATCSTSALPAGNPDVIGANYPGDTNYATAAATPINQVVAKLSPTLGITPSPTGTISVGSTVVFTAQVAGATLTPVAPGGTVNFTSGGTTITGCGSQAVNASGAATCSTSSLVSPADIIDAIYTGDSNYNGVTAPTISESVNKTGATISLGSVPASPEVNQSVTFTATVAATSGTVVPTGSVSFTQGATQLCPPAGLTVGTASSTATCVYTFTSATAGTTVTATYSGDSNFGTGTVTSRSEVVTASGTTTGLTSSPAASLVNQQVSFTAVVTPTFPGAALPTGTVTFVDNTTSTNLCPPATLSGGVVPVCNFIFPSASTHSVVAKYSGDTNFTLSNSVADSQVVNKTATTTSLASSLPTAAVNQLITFTATITPAVTGATNPGGSVTFTYTPSGGSPTSLSCSSPQPIVVSTTASVTTAACKASLPANGNYTITATYSGDSNFLTGAPGTVIQPVGLTPTTTTVTSSLTSSFVNETVTFTATVTPTITGSTTPTGSVAFTYKVGSQSGILCASSGLNTTTGIATCTASLPSAGSYSITVAYSGDTNFASSSNISSLLALTVNQPVTTLGLSSSLPSSSVVNQAVSFSAVITPAFTGTTVPTGTVTFTDTLTSTTLCTNAVSTTGTVPPCNFAFQSPATHTISAVYSGDANFPRTTSATLNQVVTTTPTTTAVVSSPTSSSVNQSVLFTATVTPADSGAIIPAGTVAFSYVLNGGTPVTLCGTSPLSNLGIASCTAPLPSQGAYTITATYSGDANFKLSAGTTPQTVVGAGTTTALVAAPSPSSVNQPVLFTATVKTTVTGSTSPTGTVAFSYTLNGGASVNLCTAAAVTAATGVATCLEPLPTVAPAGAPYTITAKYSGDSNFVSSSNTVAQTVTPANLTVIVTSSQGTSLVNQPVTFTATLTVANAGTAQPAATVAFKDTLTGSTLCANAALTSTGGGVYTATCNAQVTNLWIAATHPIVAVYAGDPNFPAATSAVFPQLVKPTSTGASLISSLPLAIATETVTFTATVTPTTTGPIVPSGYFTFTSTGTWNPAASCQAAPVAPITSGTGAGTATATCTATFPATASTQTITAVYANDPNFTSSTSAVSQTVQNFSIANSVTSSLTPTPSTGPVTLTQGFSTATSSAAGTDPFNPTSVSVAVTSTGGFADVLNVSCVVTNSTHAVVTDPSCTLSTTTTPPTSTTISGATGTSLIYTLTASATAPVGAYNVTLTANDSATPALSTVAAPLTLSIIGVANPLSLARGASGQENVSFNTFAAPQSDTFAAVACGTVVPLVNGVAGTPLTSPGVTCTSQIPTGGIPIISGGTTTVAVAISTAGTKSAALRESSSISMAAFLGVPLLALLGWVVSRKSPRRNFFRFLGLILLLVGVSFASGCGGSFSSSSTTSSSGIAAGSYLVQVVGTDQNGVTYYAAIPLDVSSN